MLREDFIDIFNYICQNSLYYSINSNGTYITPSVAKAMRKKGNKWIALYGAESAIHDHITRNPGSFDQTMRGMAYLKEAGAGFTVQIVPMMDNLSQVQQMIDLSESRGYQWRVNKAWFCYSASGSPQKNKEIEKQRLPASSLFCIEDAGFIEAGKGVHGCAGSSGGSDTQLLASCIFSRRDFHIDAYGFISFCNFVKDPALRYDLRQGTFQEAWEDFIPSLSGKILRDREYDNGCGSCGAKNHCDWCPVYAHLEKGRYTAKIESLCELSAQKERLTAYKKKHYQRFYQLAGMTLQVQSDVPITKDAFAPKFKSFETHTPGPETILIRHHFSFPTLDWNNLGETIYRKPPIALYQKNDALIYLMDISDKRKHELPGKVAITDKLHTRIRIFHPAVAAFRSQGYTTLTLFPTDIVLLGWTLALKNACWIHSSGVIMDGDGILFVGPSGSGKSTIVKLLGDHAKLLCDDRNVIRLWDDGFKVHGTWAHGELPTVNPDAAPLKKIFFLEKSSQNRILLLTNKMEAFAKILQCLIRPVQTEEWWNLMFSLIKRLQKNVPMYKMSFSTDGKIVDKLKSM